MNTTTHPLRIRTARALPGLRMALEFGDGFEAIVDLAMLIEQSPALRPIVTKATFEKLTVEEFGRSVLWGDEVADLAADNLRHLAVEQAGGIGHERLAGWMHANALTQQAAADVLGLSRRMLNYYLSASKPIPKTVWLACVGLTARAALLDVAEQHPELRDEVPEAIAMLSAA